MCLDRALPVMAYSPIEQGRLLGDLTLDQVAARHGAPGHDRLDTSVNHRHVASAGAERLCAAEGAAPEHR